MRRTQPTMMLTHSYLMSLQGWPRLDDSAMFVQRMHCNRQTNKCTSVHYTIKYRYKTTKHTLFFGSQEIIRYTPPRTFLHNKCYIFNEECPHAVSGPRPQMHAEITYAQIRDRRYKATGYTRLLCYDAHQPGNRNFLLVSRK